MNAFRTLPLFALVALVALLTLLVACGGQQTADTPAEPFADYEGDAVLLPNADAPTVTFMVWFQVGSQDDPEGKEGLARLTGSLLSDGGTTESSYKEILDQLYPIASGYSVRVDKEMTVLSGRTHVDNLDLFVQLFTDAYLKPAFAEEDFTRLKKNQQNYLETALRFADDETLGKATLEHVAYEGTRYAHPISGTVAGVESITLDDVKSFYETHYTRDNTVVALGGGFDGPLLERFESTVEELPEGPAPAEPAIEPPAIEGRHVTLVSKPGANASISFGHHVDVRRGSRDFYALWIANSWLGEHRNSSSHLYQVIRETRGMNYGDYSYLEAFPEGGRRSMPPTNVARDHQLFQVWIRTLPNEQAVFATRAALREIDDLIENGMTQEEFELTREFLSKYHLHFADSLRDRLGYAVDDEFYGIDEPGHLARFGEMMESITREEVNAAVKKHLQTANLEFAIVTGDAELLEKQLTTGEETPMEYASVKPPEVVEEDKEIASYPLDIPEENVTVIPVSEIFAE